MVEIRRATLDDIPGIIRVTHEAQKATYISQGLVSEVDVDVSNQQFYNPERLAREIVEVTDASNGYFVAVDSLTCNVVGAATGGLTDSDTAYLYCLYLDPARKREGIGTRLLAAVTADQVARGATTQWVHATAGNQMAILFYEAVGFKLDRIEATDYKQGNWPPDWIGKRTIS